MPNVDLEPEARNLNEYIIDEARDDHVVRKPNLGCSFVEACIGASCFSMAKV